MNWIVAIPRCCLGRKLSGFWDAARVLMIIHCCSDSRNSKKVWWLHANISKNVWVSQKTSQFIHSLARLCLYSTNVTWDSTSTAASLFLGRYSTFFPLARGGGVCTLFSIPFSIMSNRPPDATSTANVSTEGTTAECRRTVVALTGGLNWTRDPLAPLIPYSFFRGGIVNHMRTRVRPVIEAQWLKIPTDQNTSIASVKQLTNFWFQCFLWKEGKKSLLREHDGKWSIEQWGWGDRFRGKL